MGRKVIITLLRNDLRVHDQPLFHAAHTANEFKDAPYLLPVFVFDERYIELSGLPGYKREGPEARTRLYGFWRTGVFRARFQAEAVYDLQNTLRAKGSNLLIRFGKIEEVVQAIVDSLTEDGDEVAGVCMQQEFCSEELAIEKRLEKSMKKRGIAMSFFDALPLIDARDLPFPISETPDVFTPFRKKVEALTPLFRPPLPVADRFKPFPKLSHSRPYPGYGAHFDSKGVEDILPDLLKPLAASFESKYTSSDFPKDSRSAFPYAGGETVALERLRYYFKEGQKGAAPPVATYKVTRNGLLGHRYSTKLSPFLCLGMISPRLVLQTLADHEEEYGETQNTYWVRFELLWRDYFLFIARKYGTQLFKLGGFEEVTDPKQAKIKMEPGWWKEWDKSKKEDGFDQPAVRWMEGRTGVPFIDANMSELRDSGFMSNRGRQNVASFLAVTLQVDWRLGAEFFESHLIDYDPTANYGNWQYVSGVGNDPRASRQFNPIKQGNDYDPRGEYIKTWLPVLDSVPTTRIQAPWTLSDEEKQQLIPHGDESYPWTPVIELQSWKAHYIKKGPNKLFGNKNERVKNGAGGAKGEGPKKSGGGGGK